jgi:hypothetical protein
MSSVHFKAVILVIFSTVILFGNGPGCAAAQSCANRCHATEAISFLQSYYEVGFAQLHGCVAYNLSFTALNRSQVRQRLVLSTECTARNSVAALNEGVRSCRNINIHSFLAVSAQASLRNVVLLI